jgi:hypothetical protein
MPKRARYLDQYRDEIIDLIEKREYNQLRIRKYLEDKYGIDVPKSTLSAFMKTLPDIVPDVTPEAAHFQEQYEVYTTIIEGIKITNDLGVQLNARMSQLEDAAAARQEVLIATSQQQLAAIQKLSADLIAGVDDRHQATAKAMRDIYDAIQQQNDALYAIRAATQGIEPPPDITPALKALQESIRKQGGDITAIRRQVGPVWGMVRKNAPWMKIFGLTSLLWLVAIIGTVWYFSLWRYMPWKFAYF